MVIFKKQPCAYAHIVKSNSKKQKFCDKMVYALYMLLSSSKIALTLGDLNRHVEKCIKGFVGV